MSTRISTAAELEALPQGTVVRIGTTAWTRSEAGLSREQEGTVYDTPLEAWDGWLGSGQVTVEQPATEHTPEAGDVYQTGDGFLYLAVARLNTVMQYLRLDPVSESTSGLLHPQAAVSGERLTSPPAWTRTFVQVGKTLVDRTHQTQTERDRYAMLVADASAALGQYLEDHHGLTTTERDDLLGVMDDLGLDVPTEAVEVQVQVTGTTRVDLPPCDLASYVGDVTVTNSVTVDVPWTRSVTVELDVRPGSGCACGQVEDENVEAEVDVSLWENVSCWDTLGCERH